MGLAVQRLSNVQQEARTASNTNAASAKEEVRKLASEQRTAAKVHRAASQQAGQAIASVADKRAELVTVRESNQELQEQHIQETQVQDAHPSQRRLISLASGLAFLRRLINHQDVCCLHSHCLRGGKFWRTCDMLGLAAFSYAYAVCGMYRQKLHPMKERSEISSRLWSRQHPGRPEPHR